MNHEKDKMIHPDKVTKKSEDIIEQIIQSIVSKTDQIHSVKPFAFFEQLDKFCIKVKDTIDLYYSGKNRLPMRSK